MTLGQLLKESRMKKGLSQKQFCEKYGFKLITYCLWETNTKRPRITTWQKLSECTGISLEKLAKLCTTK